MAFWNVRLDLEQLFCKKLTTKQVKINYLLHFFPTVSFSVSNLCSKAGV